MDNERTEEQNWYVAKESPFAFSFEDVAMYVLIRLQMRPLNLYRHQIGLAGPPLQLVQGMMLADGTWTCSYVICKNTAVISRRGGVMICRITN